MEWEIEELPFEVDELRWGALAAAKACCPGVYYLATERDFFCREFYAVVEGQGERVISKETLAYGEFFQGVYYFENEKENSGWHLVEFELLRYQTKYGGPVWGPSDSLCCTAAYAAELYPDYFGGYIPPRLTPYGQTVRYKTVTNGIYFLETDRCVWLLALCCPIWQSDLSEFSERLGEYCKETQAITDEEFNYLFFTADRCAPVIYELSRDPIYGEGFKRFITSADELAAALWETYPEYVMMHNYTEQTGRGDGNLLNRLLSEFGVELDEEDMEAPTTSCIVFDPKGSVHSYL